MTELSIVFGGEPAIQFQGNKRNVSKELVHKICLTVLSEISPRDYSKITNTKKLLGLLALEFEPDESDGETGNVVSSPVEKTATEGSSSSDEEEAQPPPKQLPKKTMRRPPPKKKEEDSES